MSTNATAIRPEVAHDTVLLDLLIALGSARASVASTGDRLWACATTYRRSHTGEVSWSVGSMPHRVRSLADVPAGTLYHQTKTFIRGEEGWYVWTGETSRRASLADAIERIEANPGDSDWAKANSEKCLAGYRAAQAAVTAARDAVVAHEVGYTGWNRYFLVTSSAGHVHSSMGCSTCYPETTYAPVVTLSGLSDAEAVAELGSTLCSTCFPDAPVDGKVAKITKAAATKILAR